MNNLGVSYDDAGQLDRARVTCTRKRYGCEKRRWAPSANSTGSMGNLARISISHRAVERGPVTARGNAPVIQTEARGPKIIRLR